MANAQISRRQLFRGDLRGERAPVRPPWAIPEADFLAACNRCGDCLDACGARIIGCGDGGYPFVDFASGGCSFCADCLTACDTPALRGDPARDAPWPMAARIGDECLAFRGVICRSCSDACDESAVRFRARVGGVAEPTIVPECCTGCGHCVRPCPVHAIFIETPVHAQTAIANQASRAP